MVDTDTTAGWGAIDSALARLYPGVEPLHYATLIKWSLGGPDPLDGISVYRREDHWHFVGYGMSELYDKQSDLADESGWGFEFTFRVARDANEAQPPIWAANLLQNLGRYVFSSGNTFAAGHHLDLNGPISLDRPDTAIRAITFAEDPELGTIDTPHGSVRFLQVVGLTLDEYEAGMRWDVQHLLRALATSMPLLVTDLARHSLTTDAAIAAAIEEGVRRDGSSTGSLFVQQARWTSEQPRSAGEVGRTVLTFGANAAERIGRVMMGRLPHGLGLAVDGPSGAIGFLPGEHLEITQQDGGFLEVRLPAPTASEVAALLRPIAGVYPVPGEPALAIEIIKSQIRDQDGNLIQEIG